MSPRKFTAVKLGTSRDLMVGEAVIAIGNPFGYGHSVTTGVLSAKNRHIVIPSEHGDVEYKGLLQTDALINPGNSGGPLINVHGDLIGINTAIRGDAQGICFAIPVDKVKECLTALFNFQKINKVWVGLEVDSKAAVKEGIRIGSVEPNSPAAQAGLKPGDVIVSVDGHKIASELDYAKRFLQKDAGDVASISVLRGGQPQSFQVRLQKAPQPSAQQLVKERLGLTLQTLTPEQARQMGLIIRENVLVVTDAERSGPSAALRRGDILLTVGPYRITSLDELGRLLSAVERGGGLEIRFVRGRDRWRTVVRVR
jgi:serine protease Do